MQISTLFIHQQCNLVFAQGDSTSKKLAEKNAFIEGTDFGTIMEDDKVMSNMGTYTVRTE
jgi:hypothetical protein